MSTWDKYNATRPDRRIERGKRNPRPPDETRVMKFDPDRVRPGFDPEVWDATLFFEQTGHRYGQPAPASRPVMYGYLERELTRKGWLTDDYWRETSHWDKNLRRWQNVLREMIRFWWDHEAGFAPPGSEINIFTDPVTFDELYLVVMRILRNRVALEEFEKFDRGEPSLVRRNVIPETPPEVRAANNARPGGATRR
jgi:hypothetical protein